MERPAFLLQMVCLADVVIKAEPLASGLANDVHGQVILSSLSSSIHKSKLLFDIYWCLNDFAGLSHIQLTVLNKGISNSGRGSSRNMLQNFQFRIKENGIDYFYPGCRS